MKTTIEHIDDLSSDEVAAINAAANGCRACETLWDAKQNLKALFPDWFLYEGGNHIALHKRTEYHRAMIVTCEYA